VWLFILPPSPPFVRLLEEKGGIVMQHIEGREGGREEERVKHLTHKPSSPSFPPSLPPSLPARSRCPDINFCFWDHAKSLGCKADARREQRRDSTSSRTGLAGHR